MWIYFLRHGESEANAGLAATADSDLTARGRKQAAAAAQALSGTTFDRIYCSPLVRAMETAHIVAETTGGRPRVWSHLCEIGWCDDEPGAGRSVMAERFPLCELPPEVDDDGWARHRDGETVPECWERIGDVVEHLRELHEEQPDAKVLVVGHGGSGSVLLSRLIGLPLPEGPPPPTPDWLYVFFDHDNCGMSAVELAGETVIVRFVNDTRHLADLSDGSNSREHGGQ